MKRIIVSAITTILLVSLFIWPVGWMREEIRTQTGGQGMYPVAISSECCEFTQKIVLEHCDLYKYGIYLTSENDICGGGFEISLLQKNDIVSTEWVDYSDVIFADFTDVIMRASSHPFSTFTVKVTFYPDDNGRYPVIWLSPADYRLRETKNLEYSDIQTEDSLISAVTYENAIGHKRLLLFSAVVFLMILSIMDKGILKGKKLPAALETMLAFGGMVYVIIGLENVAASFPTNAFDKCPNNVYLWSVSIILIATVALMLLFESVSIGGIIAIAVTAIMYSAEYFVRVFRGSPFSLNDLRVIRTLTTVVGGYSIKPTAMLAWYWFISIFIVLIFAHLRKYKLTIKIGKPFSKSKTIIARCVLSLAGVIILLAEYNTLMNTSLLDDKRFRRYNAFNYLWTYQIDGFVVASFLDARACRISEPEGYSKQAVSRILSPYLVEQGDYKNPNIILILNESLSDLNVLGDIELSEDVLQNFYSLDNATRGFVTVSSIGGGTANSEYESLTACSLALLPDSYYPYFQCVNNGTSSIVSILKSNGYSTASIHPKYAKNYNRYLVYDYLGFDEQYWDTDFEDAYMVNDEISDLATYEKVIELFEKKGDAPLFVFDLTMQNHGGYEAGEESDVYSKIANTGESSAYFSFIKESDIAFKYLTDYFLAVEEPTIICMYGDHQPMFEDSSFYDGIGNPSDDPLAYYKTPFIVWANYEIETDESFEMGLCYLSPYLLSVAEVRMSPYMSYLRDLMEDVPVLSTYGCVDKEGNLYGDDTECSALDDYRIIQYDNIFGGNKKEEFYQ